jgi:hypothetical protein
VEDGIRRCEEVAGEVRVLLGRTGEIYRTWGCCTVWG